MQKDVVSKTDTSKFYITCKMHDDNLRSAQTHKQQNQEGKEDSASLVMINLVF